MKQPLGRRLLVRLYGVWPAAADVLLGEFAAISRDVGRNLVAVADAVDGFVWIAREHSRIRTSASAAPRLDGPSR